MKSPRLGTESVRGRLFPNGNTFQRCDGWGLGRGEELVPIVPIPMFMAVTSPIMIVVCAAIFPNHAATAKRD